MRSLLLALLALVSACSTLQLEAPQMDIVDVKFLGGDFNAQKLRVRLRVTNPNDRELPVKGITYKMQVDGKDFASGESESAFVVPALGSTEFDVSMNANMANALLGLLSGKRKSGEVPYKLTGKVSLASGALRSIPFSKDGSVKLR